MARVEAAEATLEAALVFVLKVVAVAEELAVALL